MTTPARVAAPPSPPVALRVQVACLASRHPERWVVAAAVGAWTVLLLPALSAGPTAGLASAPADHDGTAHAGHGPTAAPVAWSAAWSAALGAEAVGWLLMVVAMMGPVMVPRVRRVARSCPGRVRARAIGATVAGALLGWGAVGLPVVAAAAVLPTVDAGRAPATFAAVWLLVAAYHLSPVRLRALGRCHAVRVPRGPADDLARVSAGFAYSRWCVVSCGPAMAAMALTGHPVALMAVLTVGLTAERVAHRPGPAVRRLAVAVGASSVLLAAMGGTGVLG